MKHGVALLGVVVVAIFGIYLSRLPGASNFRFSTLKHSSPGPAVDLAKAHNLPWTPPKNDLPADFVEAVQFFHTHGLGDPRHGKFVHVWSGSALTEDGQLVQPVTWFGWAEKLDNGLTRFTSEDGLTYDISVNTEAEDLQSFMLAPEDYFRSNGVVRRLDADQTIFFATPDSSVPHRKGDTTLEFPLLPSWHSPPPQYTERFRHAPAFEVLAALCLIDGRPDLSKRLLAKRLDKDEPYGEVFAVSLLKTKWLRALDAYSRGQDRTALALFEDLQSSRQAYTPEVESATARTGVRPNLDWASFLDQVPALIEETQRRLGEGSRALSPAGKTIPGDLDWDVWALENYGLSNGLGTAHESAQMARYRDVPANLYRMGADVVDHMLAVAGTDNRLTRQIAKSGSTLRVVPVREIALRVINAVTGASFHTDELGRSPTLQTLTAWWRANSKLDAGEREFRSLADDSGDSLQWVAAAEQLAGFQPVQFGASPVEQAWARLRARRHAKPSVSELMIRRMNQFLANPASGSAELAAKLMYACLHRWDPTDGAIPLRILTDRLIALDSDPEATKRIPHVDSTGAPYLRTDPDLTNLLEQRISAGDSSVTSVYRRLLLRLTSGEDRVKPTGFIFFYRHRNDPGLAGLSKQLFLDPIATGQTIKFGPDKRFQPLAFTVMWTPLINLPDEQDAVIRLLKDKSVIGSATKHLNIATLVSGNKSTFIPAFGTGMRYLVDGTTWHVRACDEVAARMLHSSEHPDAFQDYWPEARKDAIIGGLIAKLSAHPDNLWPKTSLWI